MLSCLVFLILNCEIQSRIISKKTNLGTDLIGQFESAFTRESDTGILSKGTSPFIPMGEITVDPKGVLKLLNNLNIHKASGQDGLSARVLK